MSLIKIARRVTVEFRRVFVFDAREAEGFVWSGPLFGARLVMAYRNRRSESLDFAPHETGACWESANCAACLALLSHA